MNWTFKSGVPKGQNACYLLNKRPVSLNEGNYRVSFDPVDVKVPVPALHDHPKQAARTRLFHVPPCSLNKTECTVASRKKAKMENAQVFNSSI